VKGLILAGGTGSRLRPITHTSAKQLVPIANKPIIFYGIEAMAEAAIKQIGIVVGGTGADEIMQTVGDGTRWGLEITYIHQEVPLGLAHCVLISRDFLGNDDFVMYLGDNMLQQGLVELTEGFEAARALAAAPRLGEDHSAAPAAQILLAPVDDPTQFGVAALGPDGEVVRLVEKPQDPPSNLALAGVYLFDRHVHEAGKKDPLLECNRVVLETLTPQVEGTVDGSSSIEGRVVIERGAEIVNSRVLGPAIVGAGTRIVNSYVGPFSSVAEDCEIVDSELEHSVVLTRCRILDVPRLTDSLIGRDTEVTRSPRRPRALRLMLGDHSVVELH
jgi:glucose-1-phosphate thymidylyltransferase